MSYSPITNSQLTRAASEVEVMARKNEEVRQEQKKRTEEALAAQQLHDLIYERLGFRILCTSNKARDGMFTFVLYTQNKGQSNMGSSLEKPEFYVQLDQKEAERWEIPSKDRVIDRPKSLREFGEYVNTIEQARQKWEFRKNHPNAEQT